MRRDNYVDKHRLDRTRLLQRAKIDGRKAQLQVEIDEVFVAEHDLSEVPCKWLAEDSHIQEASLRLEVHIVLVGSQIDRKTISKRLS
jgi:hypothetical protein